MSVAAGGHYTLGYFERVGAGIQHGLADFAEGGGERDALIAEMLHGEEKRRYRFFPCAHAFEGLGAVHAQQRAQDLRVVRVSAEVGAEDRDELAVVEERAQHHIDEQALGTPAAP